MKRICFTTIRGSALGGALAALTAAAVLIAPPFPPDVRAQTNSAPAFPLTENGQRDVAENRSAGAAIGMPISATDGDNDPLTYSITGEDAAAFRVSASTGQLTTRSALNHEQESTYVFDLAVHDRKDENGQPDNTVDATISVTVTVTNVDEPGSLTMLTTRPFAGSVARVRLADEDGRTRAEVFEWSRSADKADWSPISSASGDSYAPSDDDVGMYLRVRATYSDSSGANKTLEHVSQLMVAAQEAARPVAVTELVTGLSIPWDIAFTPDGTMLFTERGGALSARLADGTVQSVTADFSDLYSVREVGLMALLVDRSFASNRRFYTCQAHTGPEVQVIAWTMNADYSSATRVDDPLVGEIPTATVHGGCRLRFGPDGYLWIATGDAGSASTPQDTASLGGKVLRVTATTGAGAPGNPFSSSSLVYTYGHRNVQGLALRPGTRQMWSVEHGPDIDDEINLLTRGGNYGWDPGPGYNQNVPMTDIGKYANAVKAKWSSGDPTLATSGGIFLQGDAWRHWEGRLAIASLKNSTLRVFDFARDGTLLSEYVVPQLNRTYGRLRTPMMGPDGSLYVATSGGGNSDKILKVTPLNGPTFREGETASRRVTPGSPEGTNAGSPVAARDIDGDTLTYSLSGTDAAVLDIDGLTGQLSTNAGFDSTAGETYVVTVSVHDGLDDSGNPDTTADDSITVTITVRAPPSPPSGGGGGFGPALVAPKFVEGFRAQREAFDNAGAGDAVGEPVNATHPEDEGITYSLSGADAKVFTVDEETGQVRVREGVSLTLGDTYTVNLTATDESGTGAIIIVDITVAEAPHHRYDANRNGSIERGEVIAAIRDYFDGETERDEIVELIKLYFDDS